MKVWQADLALILGGVLWGLAYIFSSRALADCPPSLFLLLRFSVATAACWLLLRRSIAKTSSKVRRQGLILGFLMGGGYILQIYSINFTEVARAAFLTCMCLLGIPILNFLIFRTVVKLHSLIGVIMATVGLYIFLDPSFTGVNVGDVLGLIAIPVWALYMIYVSVFTEGQDDAEITYQYLFWQLVGVLPLALITALVFESGWLLAPLHPDLGKALTWTRSFVGGLLFTGLAGSLVPVFLQTRSQKYTTAVQAMLCFQVEPVTATVAAFLVLGEPVFVHTVVGGAIILAAVIVSEVGGLWLAKRNASS
ncbi:MAG: DMT family transporter [Deltaproteobacteria bacterium]|jgi:drug/metabolite transporter (DMT)-like permease|nr:DMT family transporter [Deltaproteobacteria bacterium]